MVRLTQIPADGRQLMHHTGRSSHRKLFPIDRYSRLPDVLHVVDYCLLVGLMPLTATTTRIIVNTAV